MDQSNRLLEAALNLAAKGFRVFPLSPGSKFPPKDFPWKAKATSDADEVRALWADGSWNIGIATGEFTVVDIDVKNGKEGDLEALALGLDFDTFTVETPSGGLHLYYLDSGFANRAGTLELPDGSKAKGIDIRGVGGYVLGPGSEVPEGVYQVHTPSEKLANLPPAFAAQLRRPVTSSEQRQEGSDSSAAAQTAETYLKRVAPLAVQGEGGDATTVGVVFRLRDYGVSKETALELMLDHWNERCSPPWEAEELKVKIENAYKYAQNSTPSKDAEVMTEGLEGLSLPEPPPLEQEETESQFHFWTAEEASTQPPAAWLVKRTLPEIGIAAIWGPSGSGKSLVSQDIITAVGSGAAWCSSKVVRPGGTLLLAAEAADTLAPRLKAANAPADLPLVWVDMPGFFNDEGPWEKFTRLINEGRQQLADKFGAPLKLVVIDTFSAGGLVPLENDTGEMQRAMTNLTLYAKKAQVLILLVHHSDKGGKDLRGSSAMRGALDTSISVTRGEGKIRRVYLDKCRRAPERELGVFVVEEDVFFDEDGERDSVPKLQWVSEIEVPDVRPRYADIFVTALTSHFGRAPVSVVLKEFEDISKIKSGAGAAFNDCLGYLVRKGEVREVGGLLELCKNG